MKNLPHSNSNVRLSFHVPTSDSNKDQSGFITEQLSIKQGGTVKIGHCPHPEFTFLTLQPIHSSKRKTFFLIKKSRTV